MRGSCHVAFFSTLESLVDLKVTHIQIAISLSCNYPKLLGLGPGRVRQDNLVVSLGQTTEKTMFID